MKLYTNILLIIGALGLMSQELTASTYPLGAPDELAFLFGYPSGELVVVDNTIDVRSVGGERVLSSYKYTSRDGGFADVSITISYQGLKQFEETKNSLLKLQKVLEKNSQRESIVQSAKLSNNIEGITGLMGYSPDGRGWYATASIPEKNIDIMITTTFLASEREFPPEITRYRNSVAHEEKFVLDRLIKCLKVSVNWVYANKLNPNLTTKQNTESNQIQANESDGVAQLVIDKSPQKNEVLGQKNRITSRWPLILGVLVALFVGGGFIWKLLKRSKS